MLSNDTLLSQNLSLFTPLKLEIYWKICSGFIFHHEMSLIVLLNYTSCALNQHTYDFKNLFILNLDLDLLYINYGQSPWDKVS